MPQPVSRIHTTALVTVSLPFPMSETLSAWERLADDDEPFDDGEPLDDLPDDVTEQERAEIERFDLNRYR